MKWIFFLLLIVNLGVAANSYLSDSKLVTVRTKPDPRLDNIVLLSEVEPDLASISMNEIVANPVRDSSVIASEVGNQCLGLGPLQDVFDGQAAVEQLGALQIIGHLKAVDVNTGEQDYRVLIPPAPSAEEAFRKLRELQANKVDSYVISEGEQALGISLGVFSTQESAAALQLRLKSMDYVAEIVTIARQSRSYWVMLSPSEVMAFERSGWISTRSDLESREMICLQGK